MNAWTHGVLHFTKVCTCSLSVVQSRQHCDTPILVVGFVAQLARPLEALGCVPDRCRQDHWRPWVVRLTVVAMQGRRWEEEVWNVVRPAYERLRQLPAAGQTAERRDAYNKITQDQLKNSGESRHRLFNLSLLNPNQNSIPEDIMCPSKAERSARYYFWDQQRDIPQAPEAWPRSQNIPISVLQPDLDAPSRRHYGQDSLLCGFWWAYAQAIKVGQIAAQRHRG